MFVSYLNTGNGKTTFVTPQDKGSFKMVAPPKGQDFIPHGTKSFLNKALPMKPFPMKNELFSSRHDLSPYELYSYTLSIYCKCPDMFSSNISSLTKVVGTQETLKINWLGFQWVLRTRQKLMSRFHNHKGMFLSRNLDSPWLYASSTLLK